VYEIPDACRRPTKAYARQQASIFELVPKCDHASKVTTRDMHRVSRRYAHRALTMNFHVLAMPTFAATAAMRVFGSINFI
jgi:hypothetical protein